MTFENTELSGKTVAFFDGYCNLCSSLVRFAARRAKEVEFLSLQLEEAKSFLESVDKNTEELETFVLVKNSEVYMESEAVIELVKEFGGAWIFVAILMSLVPKVLRDILYRVVSKYRFALFGRRSICLNSEDIKKTG